MGSVLADPRYTEWVWVDPDTGNTEPEHTWCNIQYDFWDMWIGNKPLPYLPGQFFYKGAGPIVAVGDENAQDEAILPTEIDSYMLGGYGGIRTKGKDILGCEYPITYFRRASGGGYNWLADAGWSSPGGPDMVPLQGEPDPWGGGTGFPTREMEIYPWTRSEVTTDVAPPDHPAGSPYSPADVGDTNEQLQYGNPNGYRDAIVLVLTAGEDYIGDR